MFENLFPSEKLPLQQLSLWFYRTAVGRAYPRVRLKPNWDTHVFIEDLKAKIFTYDANSRAIRELTKEGQTDDLSLHLLPSEPRPRLRAKIQLGKLHHAYSRLLPSNIPSQAAG